MYDIITIGSATLDVLVKAKQELKHHQNHTDILYHLGDKVLIQDLEFSTGGGGTNTAVAFSRLGLKTGFVGVLGKDPNASTILDELKKEKVDFLGNIKPGSTGYSVILAGEKDRTILVFKGVNNSLDLKDIRMQSLDCKWLYISSMLGKSYNTALKLASIAKRKGTKIAVNVSPYLAKMGIHFLAPLIKRSDILILNYEEAKLLTSKESIHSIIEEITKYMQGVIVITNGDKPIHAYHWKKNYIKKINPIKPVDKTGSGDAFAAGFVYGIIKGKDIKTSLSYGYKEALSVLKALGAKNNLL